MNHKDLGKAIRIVRCIKDMKQIELANLSELSPSYISNVEQGKRDPTLSTLISICDAMEVSPATIFYLAEQDNVQSVQASILNDLMRAP